MHEHTDTDKRTEDERNTDIHGHTVGGTNPTLRIESLAIIESLDNGDIKIKED